MPELLNCLGLEGRNIRRLVAAAIWIGFGAAMGGIALVQALFERLIEPTTALAAMDVTLVWIGWTIWHSHLFAIHRRKHLSAGLEYPYRRAFIFDIFPGISVGFSQMLRPVFNGTNSISDMIPKLAHTSAGRWGQLVGLAVFAGSFALFASAWMTLGAARVGFAAEFGDVTRFEPVRRGPYGKVRHPLFWSGIGVSWSLALVFGTTTGVVIAIINTAYGLVYNRLEDRRLCLVFDDRYRGYSEDVPRIIPIRREADRVRADN